MRSCTLKKDETRGVEPVFTRVSFNNYYRLTAIAVRHNSLSPDNYGKMERSSYETVVRIDTHIFRMRLTMRYLHDVLTEERIKY